MTALKATELEFKIASEEDYQGVMDIERNMYDGMDYLPVKYMDYIKDPYRQCVVVKHRGQVIGFFMNYVVDGGK